MLSITHFDGFWFSVFGVSAVVLRKIKMFKFPDKKKSRMEKECNPGEAYAVNKKRVFPTKSFRFFFLSEMAFYYL